jgi:undecaprenyl-diphosphatase
MNADERTFRFLYGGTEAHGGALFFLMVLTTLIGGGWGMFVLLPFLVRKGTRRVSVAMFLTFGVAALVVTVLKNSIGRARPFVSLTGVSALYGSPTGFSFPSGHATGSFCFAGFIVGIALRLARENHARKRDALLGAIAAIAFALVVSLSRIYLGAHFPSDVLVGAVIGFSIGLAGAKGFEIYERKSKLAQPVRMDSK